jgi:hypothetical protein
MRGLEPIVRAYVRWAVEEKGRLDVPTLEAVWPIAVGRVWGERTRPKVLRGHKLEVGVPDGVWLAELRYQSDQILERLNELLPDGVGPLESLRLTVGGAPTWEPRPVGELAADERLPLTPDQGEALATIDVEALRAAVARVIERAPGRAAEGPDGID